MKLPKSYEWLGLEPAPRHLLKAIELYGVAETVGPKHNPVILGWAKEVGLDNVYVNDEIPWCVDANTLVSTLDGYKFIKDIQEGLDFVLTKENEFSHVNKVLKRKKQLHKIYVTGTLPLLSTEDHPFLVKRVEKYNIKKSLRIYKNELEWVKLKDIKKGDLLCKSKNDIIVKSFLEEKPESYIELLGTYAAEGTSRKKIKGDASNGVKSVTACCYLHIGKHELDGIKNLIESANLEKYSITERRTCFQIEIRDKDFVETCSKIGIKGVEKTVPYFILHGTKKVKSFFLKGYLNGDGSFNNRTNRGSASSISKKLILGIGKLLLDEGIFPTFREDLRGGTGLIENRVVNIKNRYIIQYVKNENKRKQYLEDENYYYLPIKKIIDNYTEDDVYDLEVDNYSNFIANDLVVHNCGLFMAVVMQRAGRPVVDSPLRALAWNEFGVQVAEPMLGDVLTFTRKGGGHVGLYVFETPTHFGVLGGNQGNQVSIVKIDRQRLSQARRPEYTNPPTNIRKIFFNPADGTVSDNEA